MMRLLHARLIAAWPGPTACKWPIKSGRSCPLPCSPTSARGRSPCQGHGRQPFHPRPWRRSHRCARRPRAIEGRGGRGPHEHSALDRCLILSTQLGTTLPSRIAPNNGLKHDRERRRLMNKVKDTGWHDLQGLKHVRFLRTLLVRLRGIGTEHDKAGNRELFMDQYVHAVIAT